MTYTPPTRTQMFVIENILGAPSLLAEQSGLGSEDYAAILEAAGQLASGTLAPLNRTGDTKGAKLEGDVVTTPPGFRDAYHAYVEGGWNGLAATPGHGGQGLPHILAMAVQEQWQSANIGFALCPLLNQSAIALLSAHGSDAQKSLYLGKMITGEWTGTMNLTEPQAGSDVGAVRTRAVKQDDGSYRIFGQKIFISYGDHNYTDNIIHFVLARIEGAPAGTKGLSLFLVSKTLVNADGSLGARNDVRTVSLEHKLGLHASPTAVMAYGDNGGAVGYLVGAENSGIQGMFTMMNEARLGVGVQGFGLAERAFQQALDYAKTRVQMGVPIIRHPDVRRMLLTMKSQIDVARMLAYRAALASDLGNNAEVDILTPIVKSFSTDLANEVTSIGIQVHGGMGVIEETGAAQHYRDARVLAIYEGTNGIQANDLIFRKVVRDNGAQAEALQKEIAETIEFLAHAPGDDASALAIALEEALKQLGNATQYILGEKDAARQAAGAVPYLRLFALTLGGAMHGRALLSALEAQQNRGGDPAFLDQIAITARFYADNLLPQTGGLAAAAMGGSAAILAFDEAM